METEIKKKKAVNQEVAIEDLRAFLSKYKKREARKGELTQEKLLEDYPDVIEAICDGLITFDDRNHPTFKLRHPIVPESGNTDLGTTEVTFRTRIKVSDKARIMDGLNVQTQQAKYVLRYTAYITELAISDIDRLDPEDYDVINQIGSVF